MYELMAIPIPGVFDTFWIYVFFLADLLNWSYKQKSKPRKKNKTF